MSLLLRNECQKTLDDAGLGAFHVAVKDGNNTMTIVGECGQPFVSISGIKFARCVPSAAELPLAVELLEAFLMKHKPDFDVYIAELIKFNKLPVIEARTGNWYVNSTGYGENAHWECRVHDGIFKIDIHENGTVTTCVIESSIDDMEITDFAKQRFSVKNLIGGFNHIKAYTDYLDAGTLVRDLKAKLSSCEI